MTPTPNSDGLNDVDPDTLVRRFIDGELDRDDLQPALHRIADDAEAREVLQFEVTTLPALSSPRRSVPTGFADRTLDALPAKPSAEPEAAESTPSEPAPSLGERLRHWWEIWTTPQPVRIRPLAATAVLLAAAAGLWLLRPADPLEPAGPSSARSPSASPSATVQTANGPGDAQGATVWTRFVYTSDTADSVAVAGDFSDWEPIPLSPRRVNNQTVWTGLVPVSHGEHEYQFVVNGERWVTDPLAPVTRDDGFGAQNAVLKL